MTEEHTDFIKALLIIILRKLLEWGEFYRGVAEFFCELPDFLLVLAFLYRFSAAGIFKIGELIMLIGMFLYAGLPADIILVTTVICIYSLGEHMQHGMRNTLSLEYAGDGCGGACAWISEFNLSGRYSCWIFHRHDRIQFHRW